MYIPSYLHIKDNIYILNTYQNQLYDGLRQVFQRVRTITNTATENMAISQSSRRKILVCDMPFLHTEYLSPEDINICYTTFETTQLPLNWVNSLNQFYDYCIVPHNHVRDTFQSSGVRIPIYVIHQGFARYQCVKVPVDDKFTIGFLGVPQLRKNLNLLFDACSMLKKTIPNLQLQVHAATLYDEISRSRLEAIQNCNWVNWTDGVLDAQELAQWYSQLSCYVFPSSGEGWSFTPRESLYIGIPTIISDIPVHRELVASGFYTTIPHHGLIPAIHETIEQNNKRSSTHYGMWHLIKKEDIAKAIEEVYYSYETQLIKTKKGAQWISEQWKNEDHLYQLYELLIQIEKKNEI